MRDDFFSKFDYVLFFSSIFLGIIGIFFIYSANLNTRADSFQYMRQIIFLVVGLIVAVLLSIMPPRVLQRYTLAFYIICIIGVLVTVFFGRHVMGQRRLILLGVNIQFSEFAKIATISLLSIFYSKKTQLEIADLSTFLKGVAITFIPAGVIMLLPDLGTTLVFFPIFFFISFIAGVPKKYLIYSLLLIVFAAFIPFVTTINKLYFNNESEILNLFINKRYIFIVFTTFLLTLLIALLVFFDYIKGISQKFKTFFLVYIFIISAVIIGLSVSYPLNRVLKPYQKDRLLIFFNPYVDSKGSGYHIIQSITTIGNGGLFGKGWGKGEQVQKSFVPEQSTDFIYPVIAEEAGFVGSMVILLLYSLIFIQSFKICVKSKDYWGSYVVIGIMAMFLFHILENIGMCIGLMPITGIPLPFISYGGSFLLSCFIAIGFMLNIAENGIRIKK